MAKKVIPDEFIPDAETKTVTIDGKPYLVSNDAMHTFYQRSLGEFSDFFLALRDEKKILGCRCPDCGLVRVPPFLTRCPDCEFTPTGLVEVEDVGRMLSTPPITYFANSLFQQQVPFGRGRIVLNGAGTAMSINFYTTKGILVPGIVKKGTEMKVIFRDERMGEITDIFCVPAAELTPAQIAKKGLQESELDWESSIEPAIPPAGPEEAALYQNLLAELKGIVAELNQCARAKKDIAQWWRLIQVKFKGGEFFLKISDGDFSFQEKGENPDLVMVCPDLAALVNGLAYQGSLTQAIMTRDLWISKNAEFTTIFKLERMARSLARTKKI